jgi:predicted ester cyclase
MPLSPGQMVDVLDAHFRHEAADDVDGVLGTLADAVEHDVVGWPPGPSWGRQAARDFYEQTFADLADSRVRCLRRRYGANFVVDESLWSGRAVGRPFGLEGRGRPLEFRMLHVIDFAEDGRIARENVWLDFAAILAQLPQETGQ